MESNKRGLRLNFKGGIPQTLNISNNLSKL